MSSQLEFAPPLQASQWLNTVRPITLDALRGRVVVLHAFQMLCPACVSHGLPQAVKTRALFGEDQVSVLGLHSVFEHHDVMTPTALKAFVHEYRLSFPIAIDQATPGSSLPLTMQAYALRGTPSLVLIDRRGRIRLNHFGHLDDMALGALIGQLMSEGAGVNERLVGEAGPTAGELAAADAPACDAGGCPVPP
jgi:peroxiredoxin